MSSLLSCESYIKSGHAPAPLAALLTQDKNQSPDYGFKALLHFHQILLHPHLQSPLPHQPHWLPFLSNHPLGTLQPQALSYSWHSNAVFSVRIPTPPNLKLQNLLWLNISPQKSIPFPASLFSMACHCEQ